jgi:beta-N-acetylhexosaminidase
VAKHSSAGNDLLVLGNIRAADELSSVADATLSILEFFSRKYREDAAFAQRVDEAALRILSMKLRRYPSGTISRVIPPRSEVAAIGGETGVGFDVARRAATLISPTRQELSTLLPSPPQARDRIVFIMDAVSAMQCSGCPPVDVPPVDTFQRAVLDLYGSQGANQTSSFLVSSYTIESLEDLLSGEEPAYIGADLDRARWIILSITSSSEGTAETVRRFLRERQDLMLGKNLVLFAFGPPYYFDATDLSRLTAYFAMYSKQPEFFDVAAESFSMNEAGGASPVSIAGSGYVLSGDDARSAR